PAGLRDSRKQPAGAVRPRRAQRERLLAPRGRFVQRRRAAGGQPEPPRGHQLVHGHRHLPSRFDPDHHDHHAAHDDHHHSADDDVHHLHEQHDDDSGTDTDHDHHAARDDHHHSADDDVHHLHDHHDDDPAPHHDHHDHHPHAHRAPPDHLHPDARLDHHDDPPPDRHGDLQGRLEHPRHRHAEQLGPGDVHDQHARGRAALDHRVLRRRRDLQRKHFEPAHPDGEEGPRPHHHVGQLLGQPLGVRA